MFDLTLLADAIFDKPNPTVVEAYSNYDSQPIEFESSPSVLHYMHQKLKHPIDHIHLLVVYPDMLGQFKKRKIALDRQRVKQHKFRYTWDGWGMIAIELHPNSSQLSRVTANTMKRALGFEGAYPEFGPVGAWDWQQVERHKRRLQRVFKKIV